MRNAFEVIHFIRNEKKTANKSYYKMNVEAKIALVASEETEN